MHPLLTLGLLALARLTLAEPLELLLRLFALVERASMMFYGLSTKMGKLGELTERKER
jgi:hypothetical protein